MKDILIFVGIFAGWIVLNIWVLPWFGIRTCMSGGCRVPHVERNDGPDTVDKCGQDSSFQSKSTCTGYSRCCLAESSASRWA